MKFCLIGTGHAATSIVKALRKISGSEIIAVCGSSLEHTRQFSEKNNISRHYTSVQTMFENEKEVDGVIIATIPARHYNDIVISSRYVDRIIIEKPIVITTREIEGIRALVKERKISISVIYQLKYCKAYRLLKEEVEKNIDKIEYISLQLSQYRNQEYFLGHGMWRRKKESSGGGVLLQQGIHWINLLCSIIGHDITIVSVHQDFSEGIETENILSASFMIKTVRNGGGIPVDVFFSRSSPTIPTTLRVYGENSVYGMSDFRFFSIVPPKNVLEKLWSVISRKFPLLVTFTRNYYSGSYRDFLKDVIDKNEYGPRTSLFLEEGLNDVKLITQMYEWKKIKYKEVTK